ncbi:CHAD domain-containing protein [Roseateles sp. YR242]|uniref:CYTH domain-containing protein n=1 Tax=Roseateles sp. YR242 TaxID=1855305 RepID=UPI0008BC6504|nr:CYTH domain-containing protein [Roseateles sp. YR242]SEK76582.1 CHAD domain-containing protein [Roseateles sp. YR242]
MKEIELRFQIPAAQWAAVQRWVSGEGDALAAPATQERLQARYFDTPARDLARAGFALRLRLEGDTWVQTLKGAAPDGMTRLEHNVPVTAPATAPVGDAPMLDLSRHGDHPAGQALQALLERIEGPGLQALFRTDIQRLSRALPTPFGEVELALDQGALLAGEGADERRTPVSELEIELKQGEPRAVLEVAREWALQRFGLTLELRTKALRGDLLARGEATAPPMSSHPAPWRMGLTQGEALAMLLKSAVEPVLGNASQIISGDHRPEHLHQLRVALRRLRVGVDLLASEAAEMAGTEGSTIPDESLVALRSLGEGAQQLGRLLSAARDADAQAQAGWREDLETAWQRAALATRAPAVGDTPQILMAVPMVVPARCQPAALLADAQWQGWMLAIVAWLVRGWPVAAPVDAVAARVEKLGDKALHLARRFDKLDVEGRHHLRRRLRRWKLALQSCAGLVAPEGGDSGATPGKHRAKRLAKDTDKLLARVQQAQKPLGELNDLEVGLAHARDSLLRAVALGDADAAARAGFDLAWLTPLRDAALARVGRRMKRLKR